MTFEEVPLKVALVPVPAERTTVLLEALISPVKAPEKIFAVSVPSIWVFLLNLKRLLPLSQLNTGLEEKLPKVNPAPLIPARVVAFFAIVIFVSATSRVAVFKVVVVPATVRLSTVRVPVEGT